MITIRPTTDFSEPALIALEATLTIQSRTFTFASDGPIVDPASTLGNGLLGPMSWPRSLFHLADGLSLEQQMFLPHDGSVAALSWQLRGDSIPAKLIVRPYFSGCGQRTYREIGFRLESQEDGGRLAWLPSVRGPRIVADTNGGYFDEPSRLREEVGPDDVASQDLVAPGSFEFHLNHHPSVIIFSTEGSFKNQRDRSVGIFLAGLMQRDSLLRSDDRRRQSSAVPIDFPCAVAA